MSGDKRGLMQFNNSISTAQRKLKAVFGIIRILTPLYAFIGVVIGQWLSYHSIDPPHWRTLLGGMMVFCMIAFGNCSNDLLDISVDSISNTNRPLITGSLTKTEVILLSVSLGILTILFGILGGVQFFLIGIAGLLLVTLYNLYLKKILLLGNLSIAIWGIIPVVLVPTIIGVWHWKIWIIVLSLAMMILGNEIISSIPDTEGDTFSGRITLATRIGYQRSYLVGGSIILAAFLLIGCSFLFLQDPLYFFLTFWGFLFTTLLITGIKLGMNSRQLGKSSSNKRIVALAYLLTVIVLSISN